MRGTPRHALTCKWLAHSYLASSLHDGVPASALLELRAEARMFIWIVILAMALVGGYWVKTRRQRKTKETYAGS
jgi:hypothetical protein